MQVSSHLLSDVQFWVTLSALVVSLWSAYNSWRARQVATRALGITEIQEARRHPQLNIYLANGYRHYLPERKLFCFLVSVSNPTDTNNSISKAELQVTYFLTDDIKSTIRFSHDLSLRESVEYSNSNEANVFSLPVHIDAHKTVAGWFLFSIEHSLIMGKTVDSHKIILEDSHNTPTYSENLVVRDFIHETEKI